MVTKRSEVYLVRLDPTQGHEMKKTRPCLVISPDVMNRNFKTVIIAPLTTKSHSQVTRIPCKFEGRPGWVVLDQIRAVDKNRLVKFLRVMDETTNQKVLQALGEMFAP
ncbi:MAG: type II toxin-antitoxin system PemK/MazF family toxin [Chloroflexi bacterium]|nr:type II toxin-antitoxin system PemK/MazF family toxin [Chloroflexota bacterium]